MDASDRVLMIQEDRESAFRDPPFSGGYGRVMEYRFSDGALRSVAPGPTLMPNSSTGEDGQVLALFVPGSQGNAPGHHDDD